MRIELTKKEIGAIQDVLGTLVGIIPREIMDEGDEELVINNCAELEKELLDEKGIDIPEEYFVKGCKTIMDYSIDYCTEIQDIIIAVDEIVRQDDDGYAVVMDIVDTFKNINFKELLAIKLKQSISNLIGKVVNRLDNRNIKKNSRNNRSKDHYQDYVIIRDINNAEEEQQIINEIEAKKGVLV